MNTTQNRSWGEKEQLPGRLVSSRALPRHVPKPKGQPRSPQRWGRFVLARQSPCVQNCAARGHGTAGEDGAVCRLSRHVNCRHRPCCTQGEMLRLLSLHYHGYRHDCSDSDNGNHDRTHGQKMPPETSKPNRALPQYFYGSWVSCPRAVLSSMIPRETSPGELTRRGFSLCLSERTVPRLACVPK